jgi:hypothetical protein
MDSENSFVDLDDAEEGDKVKEDAAKYAQLKVTTPSPSPIPKYVISKYDGMMLASNIY